MRNNHVVILISLLLSALSVHAGTKTITCGEPQGARIDYFTKNSANFKNESFIFGRDKVEGAKVFLTMDDANQNVDFAIGSAPAANNKQNSASMKVLVANDQQISFTGLFNGAPVMATYYPQMKIVIFSQQTTWAGDEFAGARAMLFYAKCE